MLSSTRVFTLSGLGYSWVSARPLSCRSFYHLLSASIYSQEKDKLLLVNTSGRTLQFHYVEGVKPRDTTRHFTFLCIHKLRREDCHKLLRVSESQSV